MHKCVTDGLSRYTRTTGVAYSATTVAILGELVKVPILAGAVMTFEGPRRFIPLVKEAMKEEPLKLMLPGLAYASQNILYFMALSHLRWG